MIETHGLTKTFKSRTAGKDKDAAKTVEAVKGVNMTVREGEIFGFLGPNGAGKSTTMRMLATLLPPTSGTATVVGHDLLHAPADVRNDIGYVGQAGGTEESLTGRENLLLQAQLYGMSKADAHRRAEHLMEALELASFADRRVKTYSGGQRRRLDIAMGMAHQPRLLFLDEPTTGLDPQSRARMWDEVRKLRDGGTTIFLTTHYLDEADALADRLAIIDHGTIVSEGSPDALKRQIGGDVIALGLDVQNGARQRATDLLKAQRYVREVRADDDGMHLVVEGGDSALPEMLRLLDGAAVPIRTVAMSRPTLDDVFLRLTGRSLRESVDS
ncbi:MAG: ATP-binding cassette domain-containing protein [Chloroflexota bacterium]|nr:ATP-binding cassette domain-containing protein [Chloroflexota bacterium]